MRITKHADWYSATFPAGTRKENVLPMANWASLGAGQHGYRSFHEDRKTGAWFESDGTAEMGSHLTLSGSALSELRKATGNTDHDLLRNFANLRGRTSRIDLCINIYDGELTPDSFMKAIRKKVLKTSARKANITSGIQDGIDGETLYIGARSSERYVRIYDKAAEQKVVDRGAWIRLEMECKDMKARAVAHACLEHPIDNVINTSFDDYMQWNNREYLSAIAGPGAAIEEVGRQDTNRRKWLMDVVTKSLARQLFIEPDFGLAFRERVEFHLDQLELADVDLWYKIH